ncbi:Dapper-like protein 2 [Oryzias melastigma]|uniref:Dapper-like protein 2 n=1 Tax=Oryzias melastigma TaxID=30732 RepID=A0A834CH35_ORYME|nr:Dapper-like protein 2 [Oryzias melastigma]
MAARRSCVNSLWSGTERVRIAERLRATLAGVLELEVLRCKHLAMVDAALADREEPRADEEEEEEEEEEEGTPQSPEHGPAGESAASPGQQAASPSPFLSSLEDPEEATAPPSSVKVSNSRWSALSWDAPSDLLSPPTPDPAGLLHPDSDSRPSSGFYSVSGSSLSDSSYSVSSEAAHGKPLKLWEQAPEAANSNTDILWSEDAMPLHQSAPDNSQEDPQPPEETPVSAASDLEADGLSFLSDFCSGFGDSLISSIVQLLNPASSPTSCCPNAKLDPRYCTDLVSRRTKEVYSYPSPLHAVALQSPLFTSQDQSASTTPEGAQADEQVESSTEAAEPEEAGQSTTKASVTHLEQYISQLVRQYRGGVTSSTSDLTSAANACPVTHGGLGNPLKTHGSTQSLSAFESHSAASTLQGGSFTPNKSLLGNSARVSLSNATKKATRNSINLGNLPSATGEDLNINLHLNLNLNLTPGLNSSLGVANSSKKGALRDNISPTSTTSSFSSATPTPALRARSRISTCPGSLCHRSSLEVPSSSGTSAGFGSSAFCRSMDWSSCEQLDPGQSVFYANAASAPGSQRNSSIPDGGSSIKVSEDSSMVEEISRLSGLSRAVVVGLMEQGVELDIDCFQTDSAGEVRSHGKTRLATPKDPPHDYARLTEVSPQRPIQLSLSVTHSPQSQASLTPPLSHSSSPILPYQSVHLPPPHYLPQCHYSPSSSELPSSTCSSPASHPIPRSHSPPRPIKPSLLGSTSLSVFRRDSPFQCSLPHSNTRNAPVERKGIQPRGGSLRQSGGGGDSGSRWVRMEGEGLYRGKHASHKLVRAATVSSYARREDYSSVWAEEEKARLAAETPRRSPGKLWRGLEGRFWSKESESEKEEMDRAEYGYNVMRSRVGSWRRDERRMKVSGDRKPKVDNSPMLLRKRGKEDGERRSSSLRLSRRALFRSESQGLLVPGNHGEGATKRAHWVSSLDLGQGGMGVRKDEGVRLLRPKGEDKRLSSTASLFNLSRSQSLEGSCQSLSPLSSPSFSPSPPPRIPLQRSRSLRDLGRKVFGSMRSLSLKRKPSKK